MVSHRIIYLRKILLCLFMLILKRSLKTSMIDCSKVEIENPRSSQLRFSRRGQVRAILVKKRHHLMMSLIEALSSETPFLNKTSKSMFTCPTTKVATCSLLCPSTPSKVWITLPSTSRMILVFETRQCNTMI
jgi:hypothetical protein